MRFETIELPRQPYGKKTPTMTLYLQDNIPVQAGRLRPAVIICPGGGYQRCSEREAEPIALAFLARGYQAFVVDYTVLDHAEAARGTALLPYPLYDLAHAVATVRAHAEEWSVDEDRIALVGFSAGAHLCAAYSAVSRRLSFPFEADCAMRDISVAAQVLCYPVIDFSLGWPDDEVIARALCVDGELDAVQNLVDRDTPRTFIWHTAADAFVPPANTFAYAEALDRAGVDFDCHVFHRGRHGLSLATEQTGADEAHLDEHVARWIDLAVEWLEEDPR